MVSIDVSNFDGFDWDEGNLDKNLVSHNFAWTETEETFLQEPLLTFPSPTHSQSEERYFALGRTSTDRKLNIVFTIRKNRIRVISARDMSKKEKKLYDETLEEHS
jgi:uncharacterized DUF497 family protein